MAGWKDSAATLINVRPGEGRALSLLVLHALCNGLGVSFYATMASTFFLKDFAAENLPYVYVACAVLTVLLGMLYTALEPRLRHELLLKCVLAVQSACLALLYLLVIAAEARWKSGLLMVWKDVNWVLLNIEYWALAGMLFDLRQGKRLFGVLISGEIVGGIIGGFATSGLVRVIGTSGLLFCSVLCSLASAPLLVSLLRERGQKTALAPGPHPVEDAATAARSSRQLFKERYLRLFFAISVLTYLTYYCVDLAFYGQVETHFRDQAAMASFFGRFFAVIGLANLLCSSFVSGRLMARYGVAAGLLTLPLALLVGSAGAVFAYQVLHLLPAVFWLVAITKLLEEVGRSTFQTPTYRVLYQPLPANERLKVQALRESIIEPAATGIAGVLLWVLISALKVRSIDLMYGVLLILAIWLGPAVLLPREYTRILTRALAKRRLGSESMSLTDASTLAVLQKGADSPQASGAIYCLNTLATVEHPSLKDLLIRCMDHVNPEVRRHALQLIEQDGSGEMFPEVWARVEREQVPVVKGTGLRTACALAGVDAFERLGEYFNDPDPVIHRNMIIGLLRHGGVDGIVAAGSELQALFHSHDAAQRALGAEILGEAGIPHFYRPLFDLLRDADTNVRVAALKSAGSLKNAKLAKPVINLLEGHETRQAAATALVSLGEAALTELGRGLADPAQTTQARARLVRICGRIPGRPAQQLLLEHLNAPESEIRLQVLHCLATTGFQAGKEFAPAIQDLIRSEMKLSTWLWATLRDVGSDPAADLLSRALHFEILKSRDRLLLLLSFVCPARPIMDARMNLASDVRGSKAYALEIVERLAPPLVKLWIMPALDDLEPGRRLALLLALWPQKTTSRFERLQEIVENCPENTSSWTSSCAIFTAVQTKETRLLELLDRVLQKAPALLQEMVPWARRQAVEKRQRTHNLEGRTMLLTIEKVIILKSVPIFARVPDEQLAGVAAILKELSVQSGEKIIKKGDLGTSMYIIVEGKVRIHDGDKFWGELGSRQTVGELAALDPEPRSADVTAIEPTHLFVIERWPLYELMQEQPEVNEGIIRVLCQRLRSRQA